MERLTDKEVLLIAYGALKACEAISGSRHVIKLIEDHLVDFEKVSTDSEKSE